MCYILSPLPAAEIFSFWWGLSKAGILLDFIRNILLIICLCSSFGSALLSSSLDLIRVNLSACMCRMVDDLMQSLMDLLTWLTMRTLSSSGWQVFLEIIWLLVAVTLPTGGTLQRTWSISTEVQGKHTANSSMWVQSSSDLHPVRDWEEGNSQIKNGVSVACGLLPSIRAMMLCTAGTKGDVIVHFLLLNKYWVR